MTVYRHFPLRLDQCLDIMDDSVPEIAAIVANRAIVEPERRPANISMIGMKTTCKFNSRSKRHSQHLECSH